MEFISREAEVNYNECIVRLRKTYDMEHPDRIIADISMGGAEFALRRKGITGKDILYKHEKLRNPLLEFHQEFQPDLAVGMLSYPGKVLDLLDYKTYVWGGQKLPDHIVIQAVEGEYMMGDEYADFIADPTDFWMKTYLPRVLGGLGPMSILPDITRISEIVDIIDLVLPFGKPPVQAMLHKLMEAGDELMNMLSIVGQTAEMIATSGFPRMRMNIVKTPFDYLGDTLRGTKGILTDIFRRPDELLSACERYVPILIKSIVKASDRTDAPTVFYVLHKGADGFM